MLTARTDAADDSGLGMLKVKMMHWCKLGQVIILMETERTQQRGHMKKTWWDCVREDMMSKWVQFNGTSTSLAPSLTRKADTESAQ